MMDTYCHSVGSADCFLGNLLGKSPISNWIRRKLTEKYPIKNPFEIGLGGYDLPPLS